MSRKHTAVSRKRIAAVATAMAVCAAPAPVMAQPAAPGVMSSVNGIPITLDTLGAVAREVIDYFMSPVQPADSDGQPECYTITWSQSGPATTEYLCLPQLPQIPSPWNMTR